MRAPVSRPLFLRSPPFPWADAGTAAVSQPGSSAIPDPDALLGAIAAARVGGAFWDAATDPWTADERAAAAPDDASSLDERALVATLRRHGTAAGAADGAERAAVLDRLAAAAYRDPFNGAAATPMRAVEILAAWRRLVESNRPLAAATGMAGWKRAAMAQFLWDGRTSPPFLSPEAALARGGAVAFWPSRVPAGFAATARARGVATWPVEDGFLRSAGLGAECRPPMSVIVDRTGGIHFDPTRPSELETILAQAPFGPDLLARAARLRETIVANRLGKYGIDPVVPVLQPLPKGRRIVLAIGQVEDDLSVRHAGDGIGGNAPFLRRVRDEEADAFILYRPHPDVIAGLRRGGMADDPVAGGLVDAVVGGGSLPLLLRAVQGVHVLSSLGGFEALLHGVPVTAHGLPFYAGWGLTRDLAAVPPRRGRALSLDALVAGALILAPRYRDPVTQLPCEVEVLAERLIAAPVPEATIVTRLRRLIGAARRAIPGVAA